MFAQKLADTAREISLYYFKKIKIISKNADSFDPVTIADIKIQKINQIILNNYPNHSIIGEEESF